jgi:hypothetical protein
MTRKPSGPGPYRNLSFAEHTKRGVEERAAGKDVIKSPSPIPLA